MSHTSHKFISIFLVLCVLAVGGLAQAQSVEHAGHHAHHQAATHGTMICSWMCAAGTMLDSEVVLIQVETGPVALLPLLISTNPSIEACHTSASRAPPSFSQ
jgi:hypothetical protein